MPYRVLFKVALPLIRGASDRCKQTQRPEEITAQCYANTQSLSFDLSFSLATQCEKVKANSLMRKSKTKEISRVLLSMLMNVLEKCD